MKSTDLKKMTLSLSQAAVKYIEDEILSGHYKSGDKINEYQISDELGISRAPIREAIKELQVLGIVSYQPRKGSVVASMSKDDLDEIFDIRISLEKDILEKIISDNLAEKENLKILENMAQEMYDMADSKDYETKKIYILNKMDIDFHSYIWNLAKSPRRAALLRSMYMQLLIAMNKDTSTLGKIEEKAKEHFDIVNILEQKDVKKARDVLEDHINHYRKELYYISFGDNAEK